jgi:hypothetical protein
MRGDIVKPRDFGRPHGRMHRIELSGMRFTRWRVGAYAGDRKWSCICDCEARTCRDVFGQDLRRGKSKSCGCLRRERATRHGMYGSPEYNSWKAMKARCLNPNASNYEWYGGRSICIEYADWIPSFVAFFADVETRPTGCTLDRINVNEGYRPTNVRWADAKLQRRNQRPRKKTKQARAAVKRRQPEPPAPLNDPPF